MNEVSRRFMRLAFPCAVLLAAGAASSVEAEEYLKSYTVSGRPSVHVRVGDGGVRVVSSDAQTVEFRVTFSGYRLSQDLYIDSRQDGDRVELSAREKRGISIGLHNRHLQVEVRMPKNANLQLETGDGDVDVTSLDGAIKVITGDGHLKVSRLSGDLDLHTGDGGITADTLKGNVRMGTGDGRVEALNLDGHCTISSGDGSIRLTGRFDALDIKSGDGGVDARVAPGSTLASSWNIRTGDGPVTLVVPPDIKANLDVTTSDGRITLGVPVTVLGDVGRSKVRGTLNGGGNTLFIHSGDGSIRVSGT